MPKDEAEERERKRDGDNQSRRRQPKKSTKLSDRQIWRLNGKGEREVTTRIKENYIISQ